MIAIETATPSSVLAFVTTIHATLVVLRLHRGRRPWVLLLAGPSVALAALAWMLTTPEWLAAGLAVHLGWFIACERLAPGADPPTAAAWRGPRPAVPVSRPGSAGPSAGGFAQVPVLAVHDETADIRTFRMARPAGFDFKAGQFLTLRVQAEGRALTRCYSISSAPETPGYLEISVKRQGVVSGLLHATLRPGGSLSIRPPSGPFVYPSGDDRPVVLLAGGIGITPLLSMLRHGVAAEPSRPITLLYSVRSHTDLAFADELSLIARRHPQVRVVVTITGQHAVDLYRHGRVDAALIREVVPDPAGAIFLVCGPLAMIGATRSVLHEMGVPAAQVRAEAFAAAVAAATAEGGPSGDEPAAAGRAVGVAARVTFARSRQVADAAGDDCLLDVAERAGVDIPSMCRAGACGTCRTRLVSGEAHCESEALGASEREAGWILPCVTRASGDCVLEA